MNPVLQLRSCLNPLVLLSVGLFIIPFIFCYSIIDPVMIPRFFALSILLLLLSLYLINQSKISPVYNNLNVIRRFIFPLFLCYFIISSVSLIKAINITEGIFELYKVFLSLVFLYIATILISNDENGIPVIVKSVTMSSLLLSIMGVCQYFGIAFTWLPGNTIPYATMANKNLFASVIFLVLPFIFYGVLQFSGNWRKICILTMSLVWCNIFIAQTRSVWVAIVVATVLIVILIFILKRKRVFGEIAVHYSKRFLQATVILIFVGLISVNLSKYYYPHYSLSKRLTSITDLEHESVSERLDLWQKSIQMIKDNVLLGVGLGNWKIIVPSYGTIRMRSEWGLVHFQRPHNDYLWVFSETGILGIICYLLIFVVTIGYAAKLLFRSLKLNERVFSILIIFGIIGYIIISFFSYPKERMVHVIYLTLMMSSVLSIYHKTYPIRKEVSRSTFFIFIIPSLFFLSLSCVLGYERFKSEFHLKKALAAKKEKNWEMVISEINKAESRFYTMDPMATPIHWYRGIANISQNNVDKAFEDFQNAYKIHPFHIHVLNNLATCYELLGYPNDAIDFYNRALAISPHFEGALINLGAVYYNSGRYQEAYNTLLRCNRNSKNLRLTEYLKRVKEKIGK